MQNQIHIHTDREREKERKAMGMENTLRINYFLLICKVRKQQQIEIFLSLCSFRTAQQKKSLKTDLEEKITLNWFRFVGILCHTVG